MQKEKSADERVEIITPIQISNKRKKAAGTYSGWHKWFKASAIIAVLAATVIAGGWLLSYLSKNPIQTTAGSDPNPKTKPETLQKSVETSEQPQQPQKPPPDTVDPEIVARQKAEAEQKLAEFLRLKSDLEEKGVTQWAAAQYTAISEISRAADLLLIDAAYIPAAQKYAEATALAGALVEQTDEILRELLEQGRRALQKLDGSGAQHSFSAALMLDPSNKIARRGLERAKNTEAVMQLLQSGKQQEENNNLTQAHRDYREALRLDPESEAARAALRRVNAFIAEAQFQNLMSAGLTAFHTNDYPLARSELLKAKALKPQSREVKEALEQVDEAIRLARVEKLQQEALAAEQSEDWEQALKSYLAALEIDESIRFAVQGRDRSLAQIRITKRINFFLEKPQILESDNQLKNAILLVHEAEGFEPKGPRLKDRLEKLARLVATAQTPVKIIIESDNQTEVAIYKVGKLGQFEIRELTLRPGTYTVVGARNGYQDVRQTLVVRPGRGELRVSVKCKVKI